MSTRLAFGSQRRATRRRIVQPLLCIGSCVGGFPPFAFLEPDFHIGRVATRLRSSLPKLAAPLLRDLRDIGSDSWWIKQSFEGARQMSGWRFRWRRCQRIGGTFEGCRPRFAIAFVARLPGALGELLGALAIDGGTTDEEGLGHGAKLSRAVSPAKGLF